MVRDSQVLCYAFWCTCGDFLFIDLGCTGARNVLEYYQIASNALLDVFELMTKLAFWTASYGTIDLIIFFVFGLDKAKPTTGECTFKWFLALQVIWTFACRLVQVHLLVIGFPYQGQKKQKIGCDQWFHTKLFNMPVWSSVESTFLEQNKMLDGVHVLIIIRLFTTTWLFVNCYML